MKKVLSLLLAVVMVIGLFPILPTTTHAAEVVTYQKVTAAPADWSGTYLIVYENGTDAYIHNGTDAANTYASATIANNTIAGSDTLTACEVTIAAMTDGYSVKIGGEYMYGTSGSNKTNFSTSEQLNTIEMGTDGVLITSNTSVLRFNATSGQYRFRYFKAASYTNQKPVQLYAKVVTTTSCEHVDTETTTTTVDATCTDAGSTTVTCSCGYTMSTTEIPALGHSYSEFVVTTPASCTTAGEQTKTCANGCGEDITEKIAAPGHSYGEDGICTVCDTNQADAVSYELVTADTITAGNYIIGAIRDGSYPTIYPATATCSGYWTVSDNSVTATENVITSDMFPSDAQVFVLEGNNSEGFAIGYNNGTEMVYLGYTDISTNHKLAFSADYSTTKWTVAAVATGGFSLHSTNGTGNYAVSQNSTAATAIRGYNAADKIYTGIYLFKEVVEGEEECTHTNTETVNASEATCTEDGYTGDTVCSDCGTVVEKGTAIDALGHSYGEDGICTNCNEAEPAAPTGGYELATYISVGDTVILVTENTDATFKKEFSGFLTKTTYGDGADYTDVPAGVYVLTVCEGAAANTFAFKTTDNTYLNYSGSSNTLNAVDTLSTNTSWTVSIDESTGYATILNAANSARQIWWNVTSPRFACYTGKTLTTSGYYGTKIYKFADASACEHVWSEWVTTTEPTCEEAGVQTSTCTLNCGETKTQPIAANGHTYVYSETAITCSACDYNQAYTLTTLADAKTAAIAAGTTATTDTYYIKGVVTYISGKNVYIQDETAGFLVYFTSAADTTSLALGDEILAWDNIKAYNGLAETNATTAQKCVKVSSGNTLPSQTVALADIVADGTAGTNEYLSERVVIEGLTMGTINESGNTALTDASGNTINIYKVSGLAENVNVNDIVTVTAIVSTYNGYQLLINPTTAATDVVVTEERAEVVVETVTIAEAKAGTANEYYQVEGVVTFIDDRNVYIQDATGGIVAYLTATNTTAAIGDKVKAYGSLTTFNGLIELSGIDQTNTEFFEVLSSGNTVDAQSVTLDALRNDTTNEYLAEKVTVGNVFISKVGSYYSDTQTVTYTISDSTNYMSVYKAPAASEADILTVGTIVSIEAVVSTYNSYQLRVVEATDITATGTCPAQLVETDGTATMYMTLQDALNNADPSGAYVKLLADAENVNVTLDDNVYIDLNGKKLTGTITTDGNTIYGMDSATDGYTCETMGTFNCVDEDGNAIVPETMVKASVNGNKRYLTIATDNGYTFHRFYMGITYATLKPGSKGVGYKASFLGDDMVKEHIDSFGFNLQLGGNAVRTVSLTGDKLTKETFSLVIENYDTESMGLTELSASVFMVIDGTEVTTSTYTTTLKTLVEAINAANNLDDTKKAALADWIATSATMQTWEVGNIYTATETETEA